MTDKLKKYETIGCCGIDCGLCPRFYTKGDSACPGCGGINFREKHPACGFLTCCVVKNGLEVCSGCKEYPCERFDAEKTGYDSFVTHRKVFINLGYIKENGIEQFIVQQRMRINILADLLTNFDEGRSKNFYCLSCALLPLDKLQQIHEFACHLKKELNLKEKSKSVREFAMAIAASLNIELKLRNK